MNKEYNNFMSNLELAKRLGISTLANGQDKLDANWVEKCKKAFKKTIKDTTHGRRFLLHPQALIIVMERLNLKYKSETFVDFSVLSEFSKKWFNDEIELHLSDLSDYEKNDDIYSPKRHCLLVLSIAQEEGWSFVLKNTNKSINKDKNLCSELHKIRREILCEKKDQTINTDDIYDFYEKNNKGVTFTQEHRDQLDEECGF